MPSKKPTKRPAAAPAKNREVPPDEILDEAERRADWQRAPGIAEISIAVQSALSMVRTIRDWLPVEGEAEPKASIQTADDWFYRARRSQYAEFENVRNPKRFEWSQAGGISFTAPDTIASELGICWSELCLAMKDIAEHYQWQGISDGSLIATPIVTRNGGTFPPVKPSLLAMVERAANGTGDILRRWYERLAEIVKGVPEAKQSRRKRKKTTTTTVRDIDYANEFDRDYEGQSISYFAQKKGMSRSRMSQALKRGRAKRKRQTKR